MQMSFSELEYAANLMLARRWLFSAQPCCVLKAENGGNNG